MTCLTDVPLAPRAQVVVAGAATRPAAAGAENAAGAAPAGPASMPSTTAPPAATVSGPASRRTRGETGLLRGARPASPFVSLVAAMGDYLHLHRNTPVPERGSAVGELLSMGAKES